jgi:hypothetical protein
MNTMMMPFNYQVLSIHPCSFAIKRTNQKHYYKKKITKLQSLQSRCIAWAFFEMNRNNFVQLGTPSRNKGQKKSKWD